MVTRREWALAVIAVVVAIAVTSVAAAVAAATSGAGGARIGSARSGGRGGGLDPDVGLGIQAIATKRGYPCERYNATTEDGYILGVYRIPYGLAGPSGSGVRRPVVLLQHGLLDSGFTWVNNFANQSLAYVLADHGYDVFIGNNRGTTDSLNHVSLSVHSKQFWNFTWDQMAAYDLPAQIDLALAVSGASNLSYVGHSEGTIQAFAGFSIQDLSSKVNLAVMLAPVAYVNHQRSPIFEIMAKFDIDKLFELFGVKEFLPSSSILDKIAPGICEHIKYGCADCKSGGTGARHHFFFVSTAIHV